MSKKEIDEYILSYPKLVRDRTQKKVLSFIERDVAFKKKLCEDEKKLEALKTKLGEDEKKLSRNDKNLEK